MKQQALFSLLLLTLSSIPSHGQSFPTRQLTLVVPFSTGGSNDLIARYLADELGKTWKHPVIVENRPGASGTVGAASVARAAPDGHTLLFMSSSYTTNAAVQENFPFDPVKDLTPAAITGTTDIVVAVGNHLTATNVAELQVASKARKMLSATTGAGSSPDFAARIFAEAANIEMIQVPYKGGGQIMTDMLAGRIDLFVASSAIVAPFISENKIRAIAVMSPSRLEAFPSVPTLKEQNIQGADMDLWWGVFVPGKTPPVVVESINDAINKIINKPETAVFFSRIGSRTRSATTVEASALVQTELSKFKTIAERYNIRPD